MLILGPDRTLADTIGSIAKLYDSTVPLTFVAHIGDDDAYRSGECMLAIPGIWTGMPPRLLAAMRDRRAANVTGRCPACAACIELPTGTWRHEGNCVVADGYLRPMLTAWSRQAGLYARGRRICEDPCPPR